MWGCQIAVDPENRGRVVRSQFAADGAKSKEPNLIHVGVATAPPKDWEPPYVSILISLPRDTSVSELYITSTGNTFTQHIAEMRLRAPWFKDPGPKVEAQKFRGTANSYLVTISNNHHVLILGHLWPLRAATRDAARFL